MAEYILDAGATVMCPHSGSVKATTSNTRVKVGGQYAVLQSDLCTVSGCPFTVQIGTVTKSQPCVKVQWVTAATRVKVSGQPVLLRSSSGLCQSAEQIPQGSPNVVLTQLRVKGS
jgi:uncharacterized Zn-binding protein involved in type VI secretion